MTAVAGRMTVSSLLRSCRYRSLLAGAGVLIAAAPSAPTGSPTPIWAALVHDAGTAADLAQRQADQPVRSGSGLLACIALLIGALILVWPLRLWMLALLTRLVRHYDRHGHFHAHAKAVATIVLTAILAGLGAHLIRLGLDTGFVLLPTS